MARLKDTYVLALSLLGMAMLCAIAIVIANAFDATPSPTAARVIALYKAQPTPAPAPHLNAYLWIFGLEAPEHVEPYVWGQAYVAQLQQVADLQARQPGTPEAKEALAQAEAKLASFRRASEKPWCDPSRKPCLTPVAKVYPAQDVNTRQRSQARVAGMQAAPRFEMVYALRHISAPISDYSPLLRAQQLTFAWAAELAEQGKYDQAFDALKNDALFLRRALAGSKELVMKMVMNAGLARNFLLAGEMLGRYPGAWRAAQGYRDMLALPFSKQELSLEEVFLREAMLGVSLYGLDSPEHAAEAKRAMAGGRWELVFSLFFQPHRTFNCMVRNTERLVALDRAPLREFAAARSRYRQQESEQKEWKWFDYLRNPIGRVLCSMAHPDYSEYLASQYDLEILRRGLGVLMSVPQNEDGQAWMAAVRAPSLVHPLTGQFFEADASDHTLVLGLAAERGWAKQLSERFREGGSKGFGLKQD